MDKLAKFLFLFVWVLTAQAADLLTSALRPNIEQTLEQHEGYKPERGIPTTGGRLNYPAFRQIIELHAPQFIAKLEKTFPGATFAFLGRDTQVIADITEAFYLSMGQNGRVVQVGVSKPTLQGLTPEQVLKYLEYFGFSFENIEKGTQKPFILVDTVSKGEVTEMDGLVSGRQGRQLIDIVYSEWVKRGKDVKDIIGLFNMAAMQVSTFDANNEDNIKRYKSFANMDEIIKTNKRKLKKVENYGATIVLPLIPDSQYFNESGYEHYTGSWHGKYQPPFIDKDGRLFPNPGPAQNDVIKKSVLWLQHQIIDIISTEQFRTAVQAQAQALGYNFKNLDVKAKLVCKKVAGAK